MRAVIPVVVVLALAALVAYEHAMPGVEGSAEHHRGKSAPNPTAVPAPSATPSSSATVPHAVAPTPTARVAASPLTTSIPPALKPSTELPETLELTIPPAPGAKAASSRALTRAQAVASVIGSREFQETVTPLARLYLATFGRYPDYEGINYYTGQREEARPLAEIADEFVASREFADRYGELDNAAFVERMFENVLGYASQADVRGYWVWELESGRMTRGQVLLDLAESGAFRERSANHVFVSTAYVEILRRTPDAEGYARWVAHLDAGNSRRSVIDGLLGGRQP